MIKYTDTTVFNVGVQTIVNTVNCVGVMGAGLALECQLRFPEMYQDYVERCKRKAVKVGRPYLYRGYRTPWIMNFPTKSHWKYPSKIEWIQQGLYYFRQNYDRGRITSIAFPKLGCENGGLNWDDVKAVIEATLQDINIDVYICLDQESEASGIEGIMTELVNNKQDCFWIYALGIREDMATKILSSLPIRRFRELRKIAGVGKQTYNEIFKFLYSIAVNCDSEVYEDTDALEKNKSIDDTFEVVQVAPKEPIIHNQIDSENTEKDCTIFAPEAKTKLAVDTNQRNHVMFLLKDGLGLEESELCKLKWCDFKSHEDKDQVTLFGKVISSSLWQEIQSIREYSELNDLVFRKSTGGQLSTSYVKKIMRDTANNTGELDVKSSQQPKAQTKETQLELDLVY